MVGTASPQVRGIEEGRRARRHRVDLCHERVAVAARRQLKSVRVGEVGGRCVAGHVYDTRLERVRGDPLALVETIPAEVGGIEKSVASRVDLGNESIAGRV